MALTMQHDWVTVVSNGAAWHITGWSRPAPVGPYSVAGAGFNRSLTGSSGFEDVRGCLAAVVSDLQRLGIFR